jgi:hypothetical protein
MNYSSTFPPASLLVVPREDGKTVSGVLVARDSGYLAVEVSFHGEPVADLEVQFYLADDEGERGDAIGDPVTTDDDGIARAARVVPAGLYVCAVEDQDDLMVPTVTDFDDAYPVVLPVGRPYVDLHDGLEFGDQDEAAGDESSDGGDDQGDTADASDADQTDEGGAKT